MSAKKYRWSEVPHEQLNERLARRVVTAERVMLAKLTLQRGCLVPVHAHANEQVTHVTSGALRFWIGDPSSDPIDVGAGEVLHIPSGVPHRVEALEDTEEIDVFSPPRQDWLDRTDAYLRETAPAEPWLSPAMQLQAMRISRSFQHWTGTPLVQPGDAIDVAVRLFEHPGIVLSLAEGPKYNYGNRGAMNAFELDWHALKNMDGGESAEPHLRQERAERLGEALRNGCVTGYSGQRISSRGRRFHVEDGTLFALLDEDGNRCGVGAFIPRWHYL